MKSCNHIWRDTPSPVAKNNKDDLLASIVSSGTSGWWLRGKEVEYARELFSEGLIYYCDKCSAPFREAAFAVSKK